MTFIVRFHCESRGDGYQADSFQCYYELLTPLIVGGIAYVEEVLR
jgi:hypothetical protein